MIDMILEQLSPAPADLAEDERWLTAQRIADSSQFRRSPRLLQLLLYLTEQTLLEHATLLTEHNIALHVFDRHTGFDPGIDTIVRTHMVRLRQKLGRYTEDALSSDSYQLEIPKGEYLVRFNRLSPPAASSLTRPSPLEPHLQSASVASPTRRNPFIAISCILALAVLVLLAALVIALNRPANKAASTPPLAHPLWKNIFQPHQTTTFVAADSGLVLLHQMTAKNTTLAEYLDHDFSRETHGLPPERVEEVLSIGTRRYTSFVDLNIYRRLQQLPYSSTGNFQVKYARDIQMNDLKQGNVILSGSRGANPWLGLYEPDMNFVGINDAIHHTYSFINRNPQPGEPSSFLVVNSDPSQRALGVLAYLSSLDGSGNALIIEGNSIAGTEAISDFLFDDSALTGFLNRIRKPNGAIPHFEVLIDSNSVNGSAGPFHILAYRTHP